MPWLGDGTWVQSASLARDIVHGRTNYRPWSHDLRTATPRNTQSDDWGEEDDNEADETLGSEEEEENDDD